MSFPHICVHAIEKHSSYSRRAVIWRSVERMLQVVDAWLVTTIKQSVERLQASWLEARWEDFAENESTDISIHTQHACIVRAD